MMSRFTTRPGGTSLQTPPRQKSRGHRGLIIILIILALLMLAHIIAVTHTAYPTVIPTNCTEFLGHDDYTKIVHLRSETQEMAAVQFTDDVTGGQPSALVQVTDKGPQHLLDVYIFGCEMRRHTPALTRLFTQQGLAQGTVEITPAHTLSIGQLDTTLDPDIVALLQPLQQNIYHDYSWHNGTFSQVIFPALYPVGSRNEAAALQDQEDNGETLPWSDPVTTAEQMAHDLFSWSDAMVVGKVRDNDGVTAHVLLQLKRPHFTVVVTLSRLIASSHPRLWFVTGAQTAGIAPEPSTLQNPVTSPMTIRGTMARIKGRIMVQLFDHTVTPLRILNNATSPASTIVMVRANGTYTGTIYFTNSVHNQAGLLLLIDTPPDKSKDAGLLLLTRVQLG